MVPTPLAPPGRRPRRLDAATALTGAALVAVIAWGLHAMAGAPRVPYADAWYFLAEFLALPFPENVLRANNGHLEVLPDLVRVAELTWFSANQQLQLVVGLALALATLLAAAAWLRRDSAASARLGPSMLALALGIFWLGNFRALMHVNESVHAYAVTLMLVLAIALGWRGGVRASALAAIAAIVGSLSFGSGLAIFPALLVVLALRRAPPREWAAPMLALALMLAVNLALGDGTARQTGGTGPLAIAENLVRWLAGPVVYASWPLWDPAIAERVPFAPVRAMLVPLAAALEAHLGPVMTARWPTLAIGLAGLAGFCALAFASCRSPDRTRVLGIALAAFAFAVGGLIAVVRAGYFGIHPDQLLAPRYVVWSSLYWAGLGVALVGVLRPRAARWLALAVSAALVPSQLWMHQLGVGQREVAERIALGAVVGVIDAGERLGENTVADIAAALPGLRARQAAMYAWPEAAMLGAPRPPCATPVAPASAPTVTAVDNRLGPSGRRVEFEAIEVDAARVLLIDSDGVVRGLALRAAGGRWLGWMAGHEPSDGITVWRLDGRSRPGPSGEACPSP